MTSLKTSIKTITYLSDIGCLEIQGASLISESQSFVKKRAASFYFSCLFTLLSYLKDIRSEDVGHPFCTKIHSFGVCTIWNRQKSVCDIRIFLFAIYSEKLQTT